MDPQAALAELQAPQNLAILNLSEPFFTIDGHDSNPHNRTSNASSTDSRSGATPALLAADLQHYQELFSKLRFSYVEQVTKERFLRAITADQPEFVDASENSELEEKLRSDKLGLKERKQEVRELVKELEDQGRQLAARYETIQLQTTQLQALPTEIANLEDTILNLRQSAERNTPKSDNPALSLPLKPTIELLQEREEQLSNLDRQIEALRAALPQKQIEIAALKDEVAILNTRKIKAVEEAREARRRRENGGLGDELDERGRWLRGVETGLRTTLEV